MGKTQTILLVLLGFILSCRDSNKPTFTDTPTSGEITIVCDESYQPLISVVKDTFESIYRHAKVNVKYLPEAEAFKELLNNDSIRLMISARQLNQSEKDFFEIKKRYPRYTKIAVDAVALIVNNSNPDTSMRFELLKTVMDGSIQNWPSSKDSVIVVFDKSGSANARYLREVFLGDSVFPKNWFAKNSNEEVVNYVSENKNALGVIGVNWISDRDDSAAVKFLQKIKVLAISPPDTSQFSNEFFQPYQAYIALKQYPLIRDVYVINREGRTGLGTGFAAFIAGDQGQRIVRLMGMLPATVPVRLIQVN